MERERERASEKTGTPTRGEGSYACRAVWTRELTCYCDLNLCKLCQGAPRAETDTYSRNELESDSRRITNVLQHSSRKAHFTVQRGLRPPHKTVTVTCLL